MKKYILVILTLMFAGLTTASAYDLAVGITEHGTLSFKVGDNIATTAEAGQVVTVCVNPDDGYSTKVVTAQPYTEWGNAESRRLSSGSINILAVTPTGSADEWTFTMPSANVKVSATYKRIIQDSWIQDISALTYTGDALTPTVTVIDGDTTLVEGTDYVVSYSNNTNASLATAATNAPTVTVTALSTSEGFSGEASKTFTINIAQSVINVAPVGFSDLTYNHQDQLLIKTEGTSNFGEVVYCLEKDGTFGEATDIIGKDARDYIIYYKVIGTSNYYGTEVDSIMATINPATLTVDVSEYEGIYDGQPHGIAISANEGSIIKFGETEDTCDLDASPEYVNAETYIIYYKVTRENYIPVTGTATVIINKAAGSLKFAEESIQKNHYSPDFVQEVENVGDGSVVYSSSDLSVATVDAKTGDVIIKNTGTTVITATVTEKDGGNYSYAVKTASYNLIVGTVFLPVTARSYSGTYDGDAHGITLTIPSDASVVYGTTEEQYTLTENPTFTDAGTYTVYYKVSKPFYTSVIDSRTVTILPATLTSVKLAKSSLVYNGQEQTVDVDVVMADDLNVPVSGYDVVGNVQSLEGTYTVIVTGKGNFTGEVAAEFTIEASSVYKETVNALASLKGRTAAAAELATEKGQNLTIAAKEALVIDNQAIDNMVDALEQQLAADLKAGRTEDAAKDYLQQLTAIENTIKAYQQRIENFPIMGDANNDNVVDKNDFTTVGQIILGQLPIPTGDSFLSIDLTGDGRLGVEDLVGEVNLLVGRGWNESGFDSQPLDGTSFSFADSLITINPNVEYNVQVKFRNSANRIASFSGSILLPDGMSIVDKLVKGTRLPEKTELDLNTANNNFILWPADGAYINDTDGLIFTFRVKGTKKVAASSVIKLTNLKVTDANANAISLPDVVVSVKMVIPDTDITVPTPATDLVYTGEAQELVSGGIVVGRTILYSLDGEVYGEEVPTGIDAGEYTVYYKVVADGNHNAVEAESLSVSIGKATLTVTAENKAIIYGGDAPEYTVSYNGFVSGETAEVLGGILAFECDYSKGCNAGEYVITPKGLTSDNYILMFEAGKLTVGKADIIMTAPTAATSLVYTGKAQTLTTAGSVTSGDLLYSLDGEVYSEAVPTGVDAGVYTVYYKVVADGNHNAVEAESLSVSIGKATLTVTAENKAIIYGGDAPEYTVSYNGFVSGETAEVLGGILAFECDYSKGCNAGEYVITPKGLTSDNYILMFEAGKLTVGKADIIMTAPTAATSLVYTGKAQTLTTAGSVTGGDLLYSLDGEVYGEAVPTGVDAGEYTVYYKVVADGNHNTVEAETLSVNIAPKGADALIITVCEAGEKEVPAITVKDGSTLLTEKDYALSYMDQNGNTVTKGQMELSPGNYIAIVTLKGNYSGTRELPITVKVSDGIIMAISNIVADAWYTLDGRRLLGKPTKKGLYIYKGKKVRVNR